MTTQIPTEKESIETNKILETLEKKANELENSLETIIQELEKNNKN